MIVSEAIEALKNIQQHLRSGICGQREVWVEKLESIIEILCKLEQNDRSAP